VVVVQEFLAGDEFEVELELVLHEGGHEDEPVAFGGFCEQGADGHVEEGGLLGHGRQLRRNRLHLPLHRVSVVQLEVPAQQAVERLVLCLVLHSNI
jgi:hypothetical protein